MKNMLELFKSFYQFAQSNADKYLFIVAPNYTIKQKDLFKQISKTVDNFYDIFETPSKKFNVYVIKDGDYNASLLFNKKTPTEKINSDTIVKYVKDGDQVYATELVYVDSEWEDIGERFYYQRMIYNENEIYFKQIDTINVGEDDETAYYRMLQSELTGEKALKEIKRHFFSNMNIVDYNAIQLVKLENIIKHIQLQEIDDDNDLNYDLLL